MSEPTTVDSSIVDKVRKILAKAESTDSAEEAEIFYAKATELMQQHMISEAMLAEAGKGEKDTIGRLRMEFGSTYWQAMQHVLIDLGVALGFMPVTTSGFEDKKNGALWWYGWESELRVAEVLWTNLMIQMQRAADIHMRQSDNPDREDRFREKRSFIMSYGQTVARRIKMQRIETQRQMSREMSGGSSDLLPVLVDRKQQLRDHVDSFTTTADSIKRPKINSNGYTAGRRAGEMADIGNPGVQGSRKELGQ